MRFSGSKVCAAAVSAGEPQAKSFGTVLAALPSSGEDVDSAVERNPTFLEVSQVETALSEIRRLMPNKDAARMLIASPDMLFSFQTGDDLIPYDNGSLKQLQATLRGGEGAAPPGW